MRYRWPGNVRELENVIQRATVMAKGDTILPKDLPQEVLRSVEDNPAPESRLREEEAPATPVPATSAPAAPGKPLTEAPAPVETVPEAKAPAAASAGAIGLSDACDILYALLREETDENILGVIEKEMIVRALKETGGNQVRASAILGITRATLRKRIDDLHLHY
jgi:two-component system nitrogen regulation response regulator GlnG